MSKTGSRKMRILVLLHKDLVPPEKVDDRKAIEFEDWVTEYDVCKNLRDLGHEVRPLGVGGDLTVIRGAIEEFKPHIAFNLLEEFDGEAVFDSNVVSYLELLRVPYTGCNPRGLMIGRDKSLSKKILTFHRIRTPRFCVFPKNKPRKRPKRLEFPLIVKCLDEESSMGISQASVVHSDEKLYERVKYIHKTFGVDAIAESFIEGREIYVSVLGNYILQNFATWELQFEKVDEAGKEIYSSTAKYNKNYRKRKGIKTGKAKLEPSKDKEVIETCKRAYKALGLSGYARIDLRLADDGRIYILEANPNPDISEFDEFASSAKYDKVKYKDLLTKILSLGVRWSKTR